MKLFVKLPMYRYTAQLFVSACSLLSFTLSNKTILFTNTDAFSITTAGFLSRFLTAFASKSVKVSKAQRLGEDRSASEVSRLAVKTTHNPKVNMWSSIEVKWASTIISKFFHDCFSLLDSFLCLVDNGSLSKRSTSICYAGLLLILFRQRRRDGSCCCYWISICRSEMVQRVLKSVAFCWKKVNCLALQHLLHLGCIISRPIPNEFGSNQCSFYCLMWQKFKLRRSATYMSIDFLIEASFVIYQYGRSFKKNLERCGSRDLQFHLRLHIRGWVATAGIHHSFLR